MAEKLSYKSLERHVKYMQFFGFFKLNSSSSRPRRFLHTIYMRITLSSFLLYTLQQILKIYEARSNIDKVMDTMFLLLTYTDCIYKGIVLWKKAADVDIILNVMKGPIFNKGEPEHRTLLLDTIRKAVRLVRAFNYASIFTCFLWSLHPTIMHLKGRRVEFPIWLPFDPNVNPQFYIAVLYVGIQTSWLGYSNTTIDAFIAFIFEQCRTQVSIMRHDLENLVRKSKEEASLSLVSWEDVYQKRFGYILLQHKEIINITVKAQQIFGGAIFYQFLVGGWILCTSAYRMVNLNVASVEFASMIMYILCILTEIFIYCYYGNELTYESGKLIESAYGLNWLELPVVHRKTLIILMEILKKPIRPMAGNLIPLSNSTFVSILRSSYSFYVFLKNSEHD
uniref:Odorant receptor n=1 Tax=Heortia vitessoides TaxID=1557813 RepID=A0A978W719_9NEOP|nr:odorant receptor 18 [Heortia vitessoides]